MTTANSNDADRSDSPLSDEYEDAVDNLPSFADTRNCSAKADPLNSQFVSPYTDLRKSRRGRLNILRNRMKNEFNGFFSNANDLDGALTSENISLESWGRNIIINRNIGPYFPSDSISTKAFNNFNDSPLNETDETLNISDDENYPTTSSPPPLYPPPPLPTVLIIPPPLPPRKGTSRQLPNAIPTQQLFSMFENNHSTSSSTKSLEVKAKTETAKLSDLKVASGVLSGTSSFGRIRGHIKTKSLDRGLSLAKTMKTGPFPPPSNKSNSLKYEYFNNSKSSPVDDCEENIRNNVAQGIITMITSSIIAEDPLREDSSSINSPQRSSIENGENNASSQSSNVASTLSDLLNTVNDDEDTLVKSQTNPLMANKPPTDSASEVSENREIFVCTPNERNHENIEFIDPITRDVERRMSMKGRMNEMKSGDNEDSTAQINSSAGNFEKAATFVKGYGTYATELFREAFSKAKGVVTHSSATVKLAKDDEDMYNEDGREECIVNERTPIVRSRNAKKGPFDFDGTRLVQELNNEHTGAVWCMKFSLCGRLLATAGQDNIIRVWVLRNHLAYFNKMRERYNSQIHKNSSCNLNETSLQKAMDDIEQDLYSSSTFCNSAESSESQEDAANETSNFHLLAPKPLCSYRGHTADVLDLSWSRNYFILSSGMDRTVKLWHLSRTECLCCFQHIDFVTCIAFMPKDDRYFLSGSLDGKLRLWHIPDKKVALWNEVEQVKFITAIAFVKSGKFAAVGTYDGRCFFYTTDQLKYYTVIDVRSSRGKNARGHKVTGLAVHGDKLLVTSNDSRIRMYDLRDMALTCKFKGAQTERSQIRASFSTDGKHIICGSEDRYVYMWTTADLPSSLAVRKDRNDLWQRIQCHSACVTFAIFAPRPQLFFSLLDYRRTSANVNKRFGSSVQLKNDSCQMFGHVIVSADLTGSIKVFVNRIRIKAGGSNFFPTGIS